MTEPDCPHNLENGEPELYLRPGRKPAGFAPPSPERLIPCSACGDHQPAASYTLRWRCDRCVREYRQSYGRSRTDAKRPPGWREAYEARKQELRALRERRQASAAARAERHRAQEARRAERLEQQRRRDAKRFEDELAKEIARSPAYRAAAAARRREARRRWKEQERRAAGIQPRVARVVLHDAHVAAYEKDSARWFLALFSLHDAHVAAYHRAKGVVPLTTRDAIRKNLYVAFKGWVRKRLRHAIPDGFSWARLFPYTLDELAAHLEQHFQPGMSWLNRGAWHIDHVRPIASFFIDHHTDPAWAECFALSNLRPLWAEDNIRKGARPE